MISWRALESVGAGEVFFYDLLAECEFEGINADESLASAYYVRDGDANVVSALTVASANLTNIYGNLVARPGDDDAANV